MPLRVALFVEGSLGIPNRALVSPQRELWCETIAPLLGLPPPDDIIPISKSHLARMRCNDPAAAPAQRPAISGSHESLDQLMNRWQKICPFDVAVIAWDLVPRLNHLSEVCRYDETVELYRLMALSPHLPEPWPLNAAARHVELDRRREEKSVRTQLPKIQPGTILAVCMDPMFEGVFEEGALRSALKMVGVSSRSWPARWDPRRLDHQLVAPAIAAARSAGIKLPVRGDYRQAKDEWGAYLFRTIFDDPRYGPRLADHPLARRLREVLRTT